MQHIRMHPQRPRLSITRPMRPSYHDLRMLSSANLGWCVERGGGDLRANTETTSSGVAFGGIGGAKEGIWWCIASHGRAYRACAPAREGLRDNVGGLMSCGIVGSVWDRWERGKAHFGGVAGHWWCGVIRAPRGPPARDGGVMCATSTRAPRSARTSGRVRQMRSRRACFRAVPRLGKGSMRR